MSSGDRISIKEKIGYSLGDAASHIVFDSSVAILAYFYTDIYGLPPAVMGTMFLLVRLLDAITDPIMGAIADATSTRWGRFRPWLLAICIPFAVSCVLVYSIPSFSDTGKVVYAVAAYIFMTLMYTAINIPYCSLGAAITADPRENLSLQSWRFAITPIGGALGTALILPLADFLYPGDRATGIQVSMALFGVIGCLMFIVCFFTTKERVQPVKEENLNIVRDVKILFKNDQWLILSVYNFMMLVAVVLRGGAVVYYINTVLNKGSDIITLFMLGGMFASMAGSVLAKPFGTRFCKVKLSFWINLLIAVFGVLCFFMPPELWIVVLLIHLIIMLIQGGNGALQWSMITDANNYGEWKTQRRITGMNVAANIFVIKLGVAVGGAVLGWVLAYFHYESNVAVQSASAAQGVMLLFTLVPALFYVLTAFSIKFYGLNESRMNHIVDDLKQGAFANSSH
ncbi:MULTISPECIES: glycoside-pentoside-hexuronide (GPH):cation symporter [Enterobacteriaceae]|uniref:glycoside-pentoside-hexuronide (GPH):cation symporter n=1 Tax=Enterobacteriaceae TaxID=543 RepID=UPI0015DCB180|nr:MULTISPECIES: glycoside-pentoside-hexuronide (GPH):cation symporter [unclassified Klebsiella]HAT3953938.1 MFS transporter [Kluyvera ascorbata]BBR60098.1 sugar transporter [Klebsiella sp. WP4-W18-ESBL-05]BBS90549.1 sugar transporter [Klebsiella sp. WP7-S18-CRE-02]BBS95572.1 sugar transporter [Klebsiella sp. WP7-S18-CRE-03]BBT00604.1 sugar transporter [Klebsiella sp. WP7-S18-ESBL-04]